MAENTSITNAPRLDEKDDRVIEMDVHNFMLRTSELRSVCSLRILEVDDTGLKAKVS